MARPLLSIGMIVKNEERCLEKCLKALKPLRDAIPCELVIADTGSTDKSREIAEKYADIVFDFEWINDFAAARNAVMDKCSGEWYLTVDADEYFSSSVDEMVTFLTGPLARKKVHATVVIRNFESPDMLGGYSDFNALRMVRMDTGKRYKGSIHETFPLVELPLLVILRDTIFDHDGYTELSPKHLKTKSKRNMELLEKELQEKPESIRTVLECLESVGGNIEKKRYYADYARKLLINAKKNVVDVVMNGGSCTKEVLKIMIADRHPETVDFLNWALKNMSDEYHVIIDVQYIYINFLYGEERYEECEKFCKNYLKSFEQYEKRDKSPSVADLGRPISYGQQKHKEEIEILLANVLLALKKYDEAMEYLIRMDLTTADNTASNNWYSAILNSESTKRFVEVTGEVVGNLLHKHYNGEVKSNEPYNLAISTISKPFSCYEKKQQDYNVFEMVPGAIGLSVKIANAKTKEEAEDYLSQIEIWEDFMPLALGRAIELNAILPKEFYLMDTNRLSYLLNDLIRGINKYSSAILDSCLKITKDEPFYKVSFLFNLLLNLLFSKKFKNIEDELKLEFISVFYLVAEVYLTTCYKKELLENEELAFCLPQLHLFSWYLLKAKTLKQSNLNDYENLLKTIVEKIPQSKQIIDLLK